MRNWILLFLVGMLAFASCNSDDDVVMVATYDQPVWQENVQFEGKTNTPSVQINRFVAANNIDTTMTASGLVYSILDPGGAEKPTLDSVIVAWYKGYTADGVVFDQTSTQPFNRSLQGVIAGWQEGIPLLGRGGKMWMLVRPTLAYGNNLSPSLVNRGVTSNDVLIFEVELLDF